MPRRDRSFTDSDVIRMFENNLDLTEQDTVRDYFAVQEAPVDPGQLDAAIAELDGIIQLVSFIRLLLVPFGAALALIGAVLDGILFAAEAAKAILIALRGP